MRKVKVKRKILIQSDSEESNYPTHNSDDSCGEYKNSDYQIEDVNNEIGDFVKIIYGEEHVICQIESDI